MEELPKISSVFVGVDKYKDYISRAKQLNMEHDKEYLNTRLSYAECRCVRCSSDGYYYVWFLGRIFHEECGVKSYMHWLEYLEYQVRCAYFTSVKVGYFLFGKKSNKETENDDSDFISTSIQYFMYFIGMVAILYWWTFRLFFIGLPLVLVNVIVASTRKKRVIEGKF